MRNELGPVIGERFKLYSRRRPSRFEQHCDEIARPYGEVSVVEVGKPLDGFEGFVSLYHAGTDSLVYSMLPEHYQVGRDENVRLVKVDPGKP